MRSDEAILIVLVLSAAVRVLVLGSILGKFE
jgi:hypothetical protein